MAWLVGSARKLAVAFAFFLAASPGCTPSARAPVDEARSAPAPVYEYVALDGQRISAESNHGKVTVITVITTYDLMSQVVMRELSEIRAHQRRALSVLALVLEPPKNAPLAEAFAATLELPFPIAMADQATLDGLGPFGRFDAVPTTIILSPAGKEVWRHEGAVLAAELEKQIARAHRSPT